MQCHLLQQAFRRHNYNHENSVMLCFVSPRYAKGGSPEFFSLAPLAKTLTFKTIVPPLPRWNLKVKFVYNQLTAENDGWPNQILHHLKTKHAPHGVTQPFMWSVCIIWSTCCFTVCILIVFLRIRNFVIDSIADCKENYFWCKIWSQKLQYNWKMSNTSYLPAQSWSTTYRGQTNNSRTRSLNC